MLLNLEELKPQAANVKEDAACDSKLAEAQEKIDNAVHSVPGLAVSQGRCSD